MPTVQLTKITISTIILPEVPLFKTAGREVANLLLESGGNLLLENKGVILI